MQIVIEANKGVDQEEILMWVEEAMDGKLISLVTSDYSITVEHDNMTDAEWQYDPRRCSCGC